MVPDVLGTPLSLFQADIFSSSDRFGRTAVEKGQCIETGCPWGGGRGGRGGGGALYRLTGEISKSHDKLQHFW